LIGTSAGSFAAAMLAGGAVPGTVGSVVLAQDGGTEFHSAWPYLDLGAGGHFNAFVTNGIMSPPNIYGDLMYVPMAMLYWATNEWLPLLATEWAFIQTGTPSATPSASPVASPSASPVASPAANAASSGVTPGIDANADTFQVKLRQGVMWSDGQPFTAQDVVDTFWCLRIMSNTVWEYIDTIDPIDDYTVNFHMAKPASVVERYVVRRSPVSSAIYGEWAQRARDLFDAGRSMSDPEGKQLLDQFNQFRPERLIVTGPYTIDPASITNAQFTMPKNDTSYFADRVKFDRIVNFNGETDTISAVALSKQIDYATHGFAIATEQEMIATGIRIIRPPRYGGASILFNYGQFPEFADKRVRQALAHAINRDETGKVSFGDSSPGVRYMIGISEHFVPNWLDEEVVASLNPYEYDPEKAAAILQEAGWTRDGGIWKKPDGSEAAYELLFPVEFYSAPGQNLAEQLQAFGFNISPLPITYTQIGIDIDQGKFQLGIQDWGNSTNPHPHYSFASTFFNHNTLAVNQGGKGMDYPLVQQTDVAGEVDIEQLIVASGEGLDMAQQKVQINLLSRIFNELLPLVPIFELYGNNVALEGVRVVAWPADDDPILKNSPYADGIPTMLMYEGQLEPVQG
jgi:peptide/nickel transport system substrate-binding protein